MTLKKFAPEAVKYTDLNNAFSEGYTIQLNNLTRQLIDRSVAFSNNKDDAWGEAYIDSNGRNNSVDIDACTSLYRGATSDVSYYPGTDYKRFIPGFIDESSGDTTSNPDSMSNPENAFDGDDSTSASVDIPGTGGYSYGLGKTFSSKYVYACNVRVGQSNFVDSNAVYVQTYDGTTWNNVQSLTNFNGIFTIEANIIIDDTVQGIRVRFSGSYTSGAARSVMLYTLSYSGVPSDSYIEHDIPTGTFSDTIKSSIGSPLFEDFEDGASVEYKLTNATEDSGWLNSNEIVSFTAFTSEPTTLIVKLIPKASSPTAGYPSIRGFSLKATE